MNADHGPPLSTIRLGSRALSINSGVSSELSSVERYSGSNAYEDEEESQEEEYVVDQNENEDELEDSIHGALPYISLPAGTAVRGTDISGLPRQRIYRHIAQYRYRPSKAGDGGRDTEVDHKTDSDLEPQPPTISEIEQHQQILDPLLQILDIEASDLINLKNVAITISDDHTGDGLHAERLLLAARDKATDTRHADIPELLPTLPIDLNTFLHTDTDITFDPPASTPPFDHRFPVPPSTEQSFHSSQTSERAKRKNFAMAPQKLKQPFSPPPIASEATETRRKEVSRRESNSMTLKTSEAQDQTTLHEALPMDLKKLQEYIIQLQTKAQRLERAQKIQEPAKVQILYRIFENGTPSIPYLDHPHNVSAIAGSVKLHSRAPINNFELFLERHKEISLIVFRDFEESNNISLDDDDLAEVDLSPSQPQHFREVLRPVSDDMHEAIKTILMHKPEYSTVFKGFNATTEISSPFLFFFHSRADLKYLEQQMSAPVKRQLNLLAKYIYDTNGAEYKAADAMIARGLVTTDYLCYIFKPNDVIVHRDRDMVRPYVCQSWLGHPQITKSKKSFRPSSHANGAGPSVKRELHEKSKKKYSWQIPAWCWLYDGQFYQHNTSLFLEVTQLNAEEQAVSDLSVYPLQFAKPALKDQLRKRGETFWKCRFHRLVSYSEDTFDDTLSALGERYMIDMKTYHKIHTPNSTLSSTRADIKITEDEMSSDDPPDEQFRYIVPSTIKGFNLRRKKWVDLKVDQISDVQWNKIAFKSLVVESRTKDLIQALVSKHLSIERSTDLIADKGNGLILLLHGGPGTGKTLTAESVAEIAEKPLYRVTCGDIGIKAKDVEKYLESVLHLGKIWGCVVLLDEADVFLEQRTLEDLARNALVSVFLRVLEYYDGILVLTSNRVGTFDEAFKSRIQLALHYADLEEYQRQQIWTNLINRLEGLDEDVDFSDLRDNVQRLAKEEMNGRQIRNAITTARQFAEWKGEKLTYKHLEYVIEVSGRFDKYLDKLNGGFTQSQLARDEGIR